MIDTLDAIVDRIQSDWTQKSEIRDRTLQRSRALIRFCANSIRATHRHDYERARELLSQAEERAATMVEEAQAYADIYHAGYTLDALKELAEAAITLSLVSNGQLPDPDDLDIPYAPYLNGLGEAVGELRRFALDSIRRGDVERAEEILIMMDDVYSVLVTIDFPDALTRGLRRTTDMVRGVTERTRGELTTAVRQEQLQHAIVSLEERLKGQSDED